MAPSALEEDSHSRVSLSWGGGGKRGDSTQGSKCKRDLCSKKRPNLDSSPLESLLHSGLCQEETACQVSIPPPQKKPPLGEILFGFHIQGAQFLSPTLFFSSPHPHLLLAFDLLLECPTSCSLLPSPGKWKSITPTELGGSAAPDQL